jgi:F-type H+-transporting ATPase subunit gamma
MREIKRRIRSTKNMQQITKAMEMVAAAKLRRAQELALAARPYADKMREVVSSIASGTAGVKHPMLQSREVRKTGYLIITSDRGLAGGYNANVLRKLMSELRERHASDAEYTVFVIGRKGRDYLRRRNIPITQEVIGVSDTPKFNEIREIASAAVRGFADGAYDELYLVYNEFRNAITQIPVVKRLLPIAQDQLGGAKAYYEYEPSAEEVLSVLLPKYAETLVYSAMLDSKASEFGAKMTAMGNASKNASKMIAELTLSYNRARQAAITQEIAEIVGGANALQ